MSKTIRIGIIGAGGHILLSHVPYLVANPQALITHYFDTSTQPVPEYEFGDMKPVKVKTVQEIYNHPDIDAVFIGTPDRFHIEQLAGCLKGGKHVFCEKPIGISSDDIVTLQGLIQAYGDKLVISTCHPRRFDPPITWLKKKLSQKKWVDEHLGSIINFSFEFWYHEVLQEWKKDRSLMLDHFGHEIDLMRFLFNSTDIDDIRAKNKHDSYDEYHVAGSVGAIDFTFRGHRKDEREVYNECLRIDGTLGSISINLNKGIVFYANTGAIETIDGINYKFRFKAVTDNFISAILGKRSLYLNHNDIYINNHVGVELKEAGHFN